MNYLFLVRFLVAEALNFSHHVGVVIVAFISVHKVRSVEGDVLVTSLASQCWISTVPLIFCLVYLQMNVIVFYVHTVHFDYIMLISVPSNAHRSSIKLALKLLRHVSAFLHHPQGAHKFCQLKL